MTGLKKNLLDICTAAGKPALFERALFAMAANRLCAPESKLGVWDRWLDTFHLTSFKDLKLHHMYEAIDFLLNMPVRLRSPSFSTSPTFSTLKWI